VAELQGCLGREVVGGLAEGGRAAQRALVVGAGRVEAAEALPHAGAAVGRFELVARGRGGSRPKLLQRAQGLRVVAAISLKAGAGEHGVERL
nr:hypothetical protein [Tanacetum cinerariifolium]